MRCAVALLFALAVSFSPAAAAADDGQIVAYRFATLVAALAIGASVVVLAFLVNRFAPRKRKHIRRSVTLAMLYLLAFGVSYGLDVARLHGPARIPAEVAELLGVLATVNVAAMALFDLGLPAIGIEIATIVTDVVVGVGYAVALMATARRAGVDLAGILATSAVIGTISALSLQPTLSNVIGGVALQLDSSLNVGDWVQLESGKTGRVREIRWRHTVIETRDWDTLIVPNSSLLAGTFTILGQREGQPIQHRMWVYFNVDFRFSPTDVIAAVETALCAAPIEGVAKDPRPNCICFDLARDHKDSFAYFAVRYWLTDLARDDPTSSRVRERIWTALRRANIPLAIPGAHLWIERDDLEHRKQKADRETERRLKALREATFLDPLHEEELARMAANLRYAPFAPGETVTRQGAVAHWFYIIVEGSVEVRVDVGDQEKVVAKIDAPGFFGEMGLMTGEARMATVVALTEVACYRVDKDDFHRILKERPEIAEDVSALLATRRVELLAAREDLDHAAKQKRIDAERKRIFDKLQIFFGLEDA